MNNINDLIGYKIIRLSDYFVSKKTATVMGLLIAISLFKTNFNLLQEIKKLKKEIQYLKFGETTED